MPLIFFLIVTQVTSSIDIKQKGDSPKHGGHYGLFFMVVIGEFFVNNKISQAICGESQWALSLTVTLIPWVLIFGLLLLFLNMFPSWREPFSNTIGLFVAKLLGLKELVNKMFDFTKIGDSWASIQLNRPPPIVPTQTGATENDAQLAKALANINLNNAIIINEFSEDPTEFNTLWSTLSDGGFLTAKANEFKNELRKLIHAKNLVADFVWFLLTGMLVTTVSYNYIVNAGCKTSLAEMKKRHDNYTSDMTQQVSSATSQTQRVYDQT